MKELMLFFIFPVALFLCSCTSDRYLEMAVFDDRYKVKLLLELDKLDVSYNVVGNKIKYKEEDAPKVTTAINIANDSYPALFTIKDEVVLKEFKRRLDAASVVYEINAADEGGYDLVIDNKYRNQADAILMDVLGEM